MQRRTKRMVAAGLVAGTVVVGGGAAVASSQFGSGSDQQALVADAAQRLGVSSAQLSDALKQAFNDRVDAAVAAGQLTKAQGDAIKARAAVAPGVGAPFFLPGRDHHGSFGFQVAGPFGGPGDMGDVFGVAATYLNISPATLKTDLGKGQSLAQVAKAQGKSTDGLKAAITTAVQTKLDTAVKNGDLTKTQETDILSRFSSHVDDLINATPGAFGGHHFGIHVRGPFGLGVVGDVAGAAASYLGVSPATLKADLGKGQSLAQVAKAQGKTADGLKTAITTAAQTKLDAAVKSGDITKAQETEILNELSSHADELINATPGQFQFRGHDDEGPGFAPGAPSFTPPTPASSSTPTGTTA
jgi:lambda repressor-like predicted transcriptional regulator